MRKIISILTVVVSLLTAVNASAQIKDGKWLLDDIAVDMGDGVEIHLSGTYVFEIGGGVKADYNILTTMTRPDDVDNKVKSVYLALQVDGTGGYSVTDGSLNIQLDRIGKSYSIGEGTFDNMEPAFEDNDPEGARMADTLFSAMAGILADGFKNVEIKNVTIDNRQIEGTFMNRHVILTAID